ncbi:MAG TPA: YciI-like protein [Gemmatimonadales bacterium]|nr:YciI-like protein [Gemmatimonadales bacterium]
MHYLLFYDVVPDYATKRMPYRGSHLAYAQQAVDRGELILGGALANPVDASILLFRASSSDVVEQFARDDPYVRNGVVTKWRVREWTTVVGKEAETPVPPS